MKTNLIVLAAVGLLMAAGSAGAQLAEPKVKTLAVAADPLKKAVLIGRAETSSMVLRSRRGRSATTAVARRGVRNVCLSPDMPRDARERNARSIPARKV